MEMIGVPTTNMAPMFRGISTLPMVPTSSRILDRFWDFRWYFSKIGANRVPTMTKAKLLVEITRIQIRVRNQAMTITPLADLIPLVSPSNSGCSRPVLSDMGTSCPRTRRRPLPGAHVVPLNDFSKIVHKIPILV